MRHFPNSQFGRKPITIIKNSSITQCEVEILRKEITLDNSDKDKISSYSIAKHNYSVETTITTNMI